jgi:hypothetical protein
VSSNLAGSASKINILGLFGAWKAASHILKAMRFTAEVVFTWYDNEKAAHPDQTGRLTIE